MPRPGWLDYVRMLCAMQGEPRSTDELAALWGLEVGNARWILRRFLYLGRVHIAAWRPSRKGQATALWAAGRGVNAPYPHSTEQRRYLPLRPNAELIALDSLLIALDTAPHSAKSLAEETGVHLNRAQVFLQGMRDELRMVYVAHWERSHGPFTAFYRLGTKRGLPRPRRKTKQEIDSECWQRKKQRRAMTRLARALAANASVFHQAA